MVDMERGQELHIRSCRGETLSSEERAELEAWYAEMDAEEARTLRVPEVPPSTDDLRALLEQEVHELRQAVEDIEAIHATNETLRQEISALKRRLVEKQPQMVK